MPKLFDQWHKRSRALAAHPAFHSRWLGLRKGVRQTRRWLRRQPGPAGVILMYHRVADLAADPQLLSVTPQRFAEHLAVIRRLAHPLSLAQLAQRLRDGQPVSRAVIITFDDGYADNLYHAKPLLERYATPATVFVTSGHVGGSGEFWWDELDRLLLQPGTLPETLGWKSGQKTYGWTLGTAAAYTAAEYERHRGWHIERPDDPTARQRLYRSMYHWLHALPGDERRGVLAALAARVGAGPLGRPSHRTLSLEEVRRLAQGGLIDVGAHTVTHPVLTTLSRPDQQAEIGRSKAYLEEALHRPVTSFAYPHGALTAETAALVRDLGFDCACTSEPDLVWPDADRFQLPRQVVRNWDGDGFAHQLKAWLDG